MHREDFNMLNTTPIIYFDNGATTLKPKQVVDSIVDYYSNYTANAHRGDYDTSLKVDEMYEGVRTKVASLISASRPDEIVFTKGATDSLNMIVFGFMKYVLKPGDEVLITKAEHASNVLPWQELEKDMGIKVQYIPLSSDYEVTIENISKVMTPKTKVISLAAITNVIGDVRPMKEIGQLCKEHHCYFVVDGAQSVPHMKMDVLENNIDFLAFSAHKMLGPTGVGVLYGRYDLLDQMRPLEFGGGMNASFESTGEVAYRLLPGRLEAGTPNIAGVIGLGAAIDYIQNIGLDNIYQHELMLKEYFLEKIKEIPNILVYNRKSQSGIVAFNIDGVFSQDTAVYLNHYHICVRAGNHCAKMLKDEIKIKNTCRASFYVYNTKEEIDTFVEVLKNNRDLFKVVL